MVSAAETEDASLIVALSGGEGRLRLPHTILHRWFAGKPIHMLYLHDRSGAAYVNGIDVLGKDWQAMKDGIGTIVGALACSETSVLCNSAAGVPGPASCSTAWRRPCRGLQPQTSMAQAGPRGPSGTEEQRRRQALERDLLNLLADQAQAPLTDS